MIQRVALVYWVGVKLSSMFVFALLLPADIAIVVSSANHVGA